MHINCVICSDLFVPTSDVFVTKCGHLFHYPCLTQWMERSKSCPQCRNKTTESSINRVYFNVASSEGEEDTSSLHNKIDSLKFQLHLKEKDIKNAAEENEKLIHKNNGLRDEVVKLEGTIRSNKVSISAFKEQVMYLKAQNESGEAAREEAKRLRIDLESLKRVDTVIQGTMADVEDILNQFGDSYDSRRSLATYVSVLKREVHAASEKKIELRERLKKYQQELNVVNRVKQQLIDEINSKSRAMVQLQSDFVHVQEENRSLLRKISDLEKAITSPSGNNPRDNALRRLILESPLPEAVKRPRLTDPADGDTSISVMLESKSPAEKPKEKSDSSCVKLTSSSTSLRPLKPTQSSNIASGSKYSIFKKRQTEFNSRVANRCESYDGLGGHSKLDVFPVPTTRVKSSTIKRNKTCSVNKSSSTRKLTKYFD